MGGESRRSPLSVSFVNRNIRENLSTYILPMHSPDLVLSWPKYHSKSGLGHSNFAAVHQLELLPTPNLAFPLLAHLQGSAFSKYRLASIRREPKPHTPTHCTSRWAFITCAFPHLLHLFLERFPNTEEHRDSFLLMNCVTQNVGRSSVSSF